MTASWPARICDGDGGAKADGLERMRSALEHVTARTGWGLEVRVPPFTTVGGACFDAFLTENDLRTSIGDEASDEAVAEAFDRSRLPAALRSGLEVLARRVRCPVTVRPSSVCAAILGEPFRGAYASAIVANTAPSVASRQAGLGSAVKEVYASAFMRRAREYRAAVARPSPSERLALVIQGLVGTRHAERFYPLVSGTARSYNFYPMGPARPADGLVEMALGLGHAIARDRAAWVFSPAFPHANPPYNSVAQLAALTQARFWALDLSESGPAAAPPASAPLRQYDLTVAERDGALRLSGSTFLVDEDRIAMGTSRRGPRVIDFAPILRTRVIPLVADLSGLVRLAEELFDTAIELEFALTESNADGGATLWVLEAGPMLAAFQTVDATVAAGSAPVIVASGGSLGNGSSLSVRDVVLALDRRFAPDRSLAVRDEVRSVNRRMVERGRPYLLVGSGRWGSSDPSVGVPVEASDIDGAHTIVEVSDPDGPIPNSRGSHLFHHLFRSGTRYLPVGDGRDDVIDWTWFERQPPAARTERIRHIRLDVPLDIRVDGRTGMAAVVPVGQAIR